MMRRERLSVSLWSVAVPGRPAVINGVRLAWPAEPEASAKGPRAAARARRTLTLRSDDLAATVRDAKPWLRSVMAAQLRVGGATPPHGEGRCGSASTMRNGDAKPRRPPLAIALYAGRRSRSGPRLNRGAQPQVGGTNLKLKRTSREARAACGRAPCRLHDATDERRDGLRSKESAGMGKCVSQFALRAAGRPLLVTVSAGAAGGGGSARLGRGLGERSRARPPPAPSQPSASARLDRSLPHRRPVFQGGAGGERLVRV
mmetsp:Transcript_22906/g.76896  ORF Transcript_22906/g.76896 Transcript_22906/m.76896 type:complete len:259 (-) Transcript_22906:61-837(-)